MRLKDETTLSIAPRNYGLKGAEQRIFAGVS
jgi:hypothetical protein